ncbi:hypothetical protein F5J12DRAFT_779605 [Pisolithus orientalis]|uniref:uncharacterized protein n=1 Tax=Pisolithus orientalis TaxID=936130 RepID=UPI00222437AF|nr:uncharacterized protein F5J12DRAFT_779605 [Pisolithus orientalis]KAI6030449.1 hypothetical protein F5J12DRAFT_779605 [Pisolithus orientalis]
MTEFHALVHLADELFARFEQKGRPSDLSLVVIHYRSALALASSDPTLSNDVRSKLLSNLANILSVRFQRCGDVADLTQSIECYVAALELRPPGHPARASTLASYATALLLRYGQLGVEEDIEFAIEHLQAALEILPPTGPSRLMSLINYASALFSRFQYTEDISDLDMAISHYHGILNTCPLENKATACYNLANALLSRFKIRHEAVDLNSSIEYSYVALHAMKEGHPDHPLIITGLATGLIRRFQLRGGAADLGPAITNFQLALDLRPPGNPTRFSAPSDIADALVMRYNHSEELVDLQLAIDHYREALRLLPPKHKSEPILLDNLGNALFLRQIRLGDLKDLDEAIEKHRLALDLCAGDSIRVVLMLEALANYHDVRFKRKENPADLHSAIHYFNEALLLAPADHPHYVSILNSIALCLGTRFQAYGELADLNRAISCCREVLELLSLGHQRRALTLHTLAEALLQRFEETGDEFDIQQAYLHSCLNEPPPKYCARIIRARFLPWNDAEDLEPVFRHLRSAKDSCTADDPLLPEVHAELSTAYFLRYILTRRPSELKQALGHHQLSLALAEGASSPAFRASMQWARDAEIYNHSSMVDAYRTAVQLLGSARPRNEVARYPTVFGGAQRSQVGWRCCVSLLRTIGMLEYARGLLWAQLVRVMTALDDLRAMGEPGVGLAKLGAFASTAPKKSRPLLKAKYAVIDQIRRKQGFKDFLAQPEFSQLQKAASEGPVIITTTGQRSCDALIVWRAGPPVHVPLPDISLADISLMASKFEDLTKGTGQVPCSKTREYQLAELLSDLWDQACASYRAAADSPYTKRLPVVVVPYGTSVTQLPVRRTTLTSGISGFLKSKKSKQSLLHPDTPSSSRSALATVVAIGHPDSEGTDDQFDFVRNCIPPTVPFKAIEGEEVSRVTVSNSLKESSWVHFACPVVHDSSRPFRSAFEMWDGSLTVYDIARIRPSVDFAFVSTCRIVKRDSDSVHESMSLPACLQYTGFRSVIGPLWTVDAEVTRRVVSCFYEKARSAGTIHQLDAATALNEALKMIGETVPLSQRIAFVHVGV